MADALARNGGGSKLRGFLKTVGELVFLGDGRRLLGGGRYQKALDRLERVSPNAKFYRHAVALSAFCQIRLLRIKEARQSIEVLRIRTGEDDPLYDAYADHLAAVMSGDIDAYHESVRRLDRQDVDQRKRKSLVLFSLKQEIQPANLR